MNVRGPRDLQVTRTVTSGPAPATSMPSSPTTVKPTSPIANFARFIHSCCDMALSSEPVEGRAGGLCGGRSKYANCRHDEAEIFHDTTTPLMSTRADLRSIAAIKLAFLRCSNGKSPVL